MEENDMESKFAMNVRLLKEKRDLKMKQLGKDPIAAIEKITEEKTKKIISSNYSTKPEEIQKTEIGQCLNKEDLPENSEQSKLTNEDESVIRPKTNGLMKPVLVDVRRKSPLTTEYMDKEHMKSNTSSDQSPQNIRLIEGCISDPEPPRLRFKVRTAKEQVEEVLRRNGKPDAKETPISDRCASKITELKVLSSQQNVTKLFKITNQAINEATREAQGPAVIANSNMLVTDKPKPNNSLEVSQSDSETMNGRSQLENISDDCIEISTKEPDAMVENSNNNTETVGCGDCREMNETLQLSDDEKPKFERAIKNEELPNPRKREFEISSEQDLEDNFENISESCSDISDSGIYSGIRSSTEDHLLSSLSGQSPQNCYISSIKDFRRSQRKKRGVFERPRVPGCWPNGALVNTSRLTTLRRNDDNKKRELQKECLREKIRQISSALNSDTHRKLSVDKENEARSECEKQLLISTEEYSWLEKANMMFDYPDFSQSKGQIEISDILLKINTTNIMDELKQFTNFWIVGIITIGDQFFATQMKKIDGIGELTTNSVTLKAKQVFEDIPPNFEMELFLYCYKTVNLNCTKSRSNALNSFVSSMFGSKKYRRSSTSLVHTSEISLGTPNAIRKTNFKLIGSKVLNLSAVSKFSNTMKKVNLQNSHLDESDIFTTTCHFKLSSKFIKSVQYSSFLTIKLGHDQGYGSWIRFWAQLRKDKVFFWKYPEDAEDGKKFEYFLSLRQLLNTSIRAPRGFNLRRNTFELYAKEWEDAMPASHIVGVTLDYDQNKFLRYLLSTDTPVEKEKWCQGIQTVLNEMRKWDLVLPVPQNDD